jgi:hypothetical protein
VILSFILSGMLEVTPSNLWVRAQWKFWWWRVEVEQDMTEEAGVEREE